MFFQRVFYHKNFNFKKIFNALLFKRVLEKERETEMKKRHIAEKAKEKINILRFFRN